VTSTIIHVEVFRDSVALESIRTFWQTWQNHPNIDIDFFQTVIRARPEILRPHVLLVRNQEKPEALLVGRIERQKLIFKLGYLKLNLFQSEVRTLIVPLGGVFGNVSEEICISLVREVHTLLRSGEVNMVIFSLLRTDSSIYNHLAANMPWCFRYKHTSIRHRALALPDSVEAYFASLSSKTRKHLRQNAKKLINDFSDSIRVTTYTKASELGVMLQDVESISRKTWQRDFGVGFAINPEMQSRLRLQVKRGWLRAHVLYLANKPCAFWLCTAYNGTLHSDYLGYDPAYSSYAPGMFLMTQVIEGLCNDKGADRLSEIDFGLGDAQYKQQLATRCWEEASLQFFAPSFKGLSINLLTTSLDSVDRFSRRLLDRTTLFARVKTLWRKTVKRATGNLN
jgi:hypothetical protein